MSELSERLKQSYVSGNGIGLMEARHLIDEVEQLELANSEKQKRIEHLEAETVCLPCKIGDTLYFWTESYSDENPQPYVGEFLVRGIQIMPDGIYVFDGDHWDKLGTQFAYLTHAEADAAIEKEKAK